MVEFCCECGISLPKGDVSIRDGQEYTSHDYLCPSCGKPANPAAVAAGEVDLDSDDVNIEIRSGQAEQKD